MVMKYSVVLVVFNDDLATSYLSPELSLSRHSGSVPWGFTLSGGQDQALTIKVGCVLQVRNYNQLFGYKYITWRIRARGSF